MLSCWNQVVESKNLKLSKKLAFWINQVSAIYPGLGGTNGESAQMGICWFRWSLSMAVTVNKPAQDRGDREARQWRDIRWPRSYLSVCLPVVFYFYFFCLICFAISSISISIHPSIYRSIHLSIYLSIYLSCAVLCCAVLCCAVLCYPMLQHFSLLEGFKSQKCHWVTSKVNFYIFSTTQLFIFFNGKTRWVNSISAPVLARPIDSLKSPWLLQTDGFYLSIGLIYQK